MAGKPILDPEGLKNLLLNSSFSNELDQKFGINSINLANCQISDLYSYDDQNFKLTLNFSSPQHNFDKIYFVKIQNLYNVDADADLAEQANQVIDKFIDFWDNFLAQKILFCRKIEQKIPIKNIYEKLEKSRKATSSSSEHSACLLKICNWLPRENIAKFIKFDHPNLAKFIRESLQILNSLHAASRRYCAQHDVAPVKNLIRSWDLSNWVQIAEDLDHFDLIKKMHIDIALEIDSVATNFNQILEKFRKSETILIHHDLHPENILGTSHLGITGVIDYNDAIISWPIIDVAIFVASVLSQLAKDLRNIDLLPVYQQILGHAYQLYEPKNFSQAELLIFVKSRLCQLVCFLTEDAELQPENYADFISHIASAKRSLHILSKIK